MNRPLWTALFLFFCAQGLRGEKTDLSSRPEPATVVEWIEQLNHENGNRRKEAREQLHSAAVRYPRFMISILVPRYKKETHPESVYRLSRILKTCAVHSLFYYPDGFLGITFRMKESMDLSGSTIEVLSVLPESAAHKAGLQQGDLLLTIDRRPVGAFVHEAGFAQYIQTKLPGEVLHVRVKRNDSTFDSAIRLGVRNVNQPDLETQLKQADEQVADWLRGLRQPDMTDEGRPEGSFEVP